MHRFSWFGLLQIKLLQKWWLLTQRVTYVYLCGSSLFHMVTVLLEYFDITCIWRCSYSSSSFPTFSNPGYFMLEGSSTLSSSSSLARIITMIMTTGGNGYIGIRIQNRPISECSISALVWYRSNHWLPFESFKQEIVQTVDDKDNARHNYLLSQTKRHQLAIL